MAKVKIYNSLWDRELADIDRMIDENSADAAKARSKAQQRGLRENIQRLEAERDALLESR